MLSNIGCLSLTAFGLFIIFANANSWKIESRIVGGSAAVEQQFPYQVAIRDNDNSIHFCGGAIVTSRYVLTAAHCFFDRPLNASLIHGIVNRTHISDPGTFIHFIDVILHPEFGKRRAEPDIGLIKSREEITFSEFVRPVHLPIQEAQSGVSAVFSGWGLINVSFARNSC